MKKTKKKAKLDLGGRPSNDPGVPWCGRALQVRRAHHGITAVELAVRIGVSASSVHHWETDRYSPKAEHVAKMAKLLKCKPSGFSKVPELSKQ